MYGPLNVKYFDTSFFVTHYSIGKIIQQYNAALLLQDTVHRLNNFSAEKVTELPFSIFERKV